MSRDDKTRETKAPRPLSGDRSRTSGGSADPWAADEQTRLSKQRRPQAKLRLRMSTHDAHYGGNLVDGARMLALFGDVATELLIRLDGDEGLFRAYDRVEFLAPVHAGDYVEAVGRLVDLGNTSRRIEFEAWKVIRARPDLSDSAAEVLEEPVLVARASGTCVVPAAKQRHR